MRYLIAGIITGALLNMLPLFQPAGGIELYPEWYGSVQRPETIEKSGNAAAAKVALPPVLIPGSIVALSGDGAVRQVRDTGGRLYSVSGNGRYYAAFDRTGSKIEFLSILGEPFWNIASREFPYLSRNGKLVLLLSSDHSSIRVMDFNGNLLGSGPLYGRFVTVIAFSKKADCAGVGFLDGGYYFIDKDGKVLRSGRLPDNSLVKSIAISPNGRYAAVHFGNERGDGIMIMRLDSETQHLCPLKRVHLTRTALHIADSGTVSVLDHNSIHMISRRGKITASIKVPPAKPGAASIVSAGRLYAAGYTGTEGAPRFLLYRDDGTVLYGRDFPAESFLEAAVEEDLILLRGSRSLYCYSFASPDRP
jgi:hypothetical protein